MASINRIDQQHRAESTLMSRFGLSAAQMDWVKSTAMEQLNELSALDCPPLLALVTLQYASHLAQNLTQGMTQKDLIQIASDNRQLFDDLARWHADEIANAMAQGTESAALINLN